MLTLRHSSASLCVPRVSIHTLAALCRLDEGAQCYTEWWVFCVSPSSSSATVVHTLHRADLVSRCGLGVPLSSSQLVVYLPFIPLARSDFFLAYFEIHFLLKLQIPTGEICFVLTFYQLRIL